MNFRKNIILGITVVVLIAGLVFFLASRYAPADRVIGKTDEEEISAITELTQTIDEINVKLDSIRNQHNSFRSETGNTEMRSKRQLIMENISSIGNLVNQYENQLRKATASLRSAEKDNSVLRKKLLLFETNRGDIIRELEDIKYELQLSEKQNVILAQNLKDEKRKSERIKAKLSVTEDLAYTAYYVCGDRRQLKKMEIIDSKTGDLPMHEFERVDARAEAIIPTHAKNVKLLTRHENSSYTWQDDDQGNKNLCIIEPLRFWQSSKYLIIEVK